MVAVTQHEGAPIGEPSPRTGPPHRTPHEMREALMKAAGRFMWVWRLHRLVLVLAWLGLAMVTVLVAVGRFEFTRAPILDGIGLILAWLLLWVWTSLHAGRTNVLLDRIIERRLCLHCGTPLLKAQTDEDGKGDCPHCRHPFSLDDYASPRACLEALRRVREQLKERLHEQTLPDERLAEIRAELRAKHRFRSPAVYESHQHFDRVMNEAALRLAWRRYPGAWVRYALIGTGLPIVAGLLLVPWFFQAGLAVFILVFVVIAPIYAVLIAYEGTRQAMVTRILDHHLCLQCGYPLEGLPLDQRGAGRCPECGRAFLTREYRLPGAEDVNPNWRELREALLFWKDDEPEVVLPKRGDEVSSAAGSARSAPPAERPVCPRCGYPLTGLPVDDEGEGACPECGTPFWQNRDHLSTANTSVIA